MAKVARKLGIDCAPAVVGFEFHGGHSHPMYVCVCVYVHMYIYLCVCLCIYGAGYIYECELIAHDITYQAHINSVGWIRKISALEIT